MTQGVIIYLLGGGKPPRGVEPGTLFQGLTQPAGPTEVVISQPDALELDDAWHLLLSRGCDPIHLLVTQAEADRLRPLYPLVRLSGITRAGQKPAGAPWPGRVLH
jgi:hypothetical protein